MAWRPEVYLKNGEKYNRLTVVAMYTYRADGCSKGLRTRYKCRCDCGTVVDGLHGCELLSGSRKCCSKGCPTIRANVTKEEMSARGKKAVASRRRSGGEERRIAAIKQAFRDGRYKARDKQASESIKRRMESIQKAAAEGRRKKGYTWAKGKNHYWFRTSEEKVSAQRKKMREGGCKSTPNKFETGIAAFLTKYGFEFDYTGNRAFWIGPSKWGRHRNPDFVSRRRKDKIAILAHGRYWHRDKGEVRDELRDYKNLGWRCFVIWDSDVLDDAMASRIQDFIHDGR